MSKLYLTVLLCLIYVIWCGSEAKGRSKKRLPCWHNRTKYNRRYSRAQENPCEYWHCLPNGTMEVTKCPDDPLPSDSGYGSCKNVRHGGKWPKCCYFSRLC
uniref:9.4 kDa family member n=1 Tax=Rhipicephalus zambeziensis TaxID=60191 RepID=A0A224Y7A2_9ACAR